MSQETIFETEQIVYRTSVLQGNGLSSKPSILTTQRFKWL